MFFKRTSQQLTEDEVADIIDELSECIQYRISTMSYVHGSISQVEGPCEERNHFCQVIIAEDVELVENIIKTQACYERLRDISIWSAVTIPKDVANLRKAYLKINIIMLDMDPAFDIAASAFSDYAMRIIHSLENSRNQLNTKLVSEAFSNSVHSLRKINKGIDKIGKIIMRQYIMRQKCQELEARRDARAEQAFMRELVLLRNADDQEEEAGQGNAYPVFIC
jgi:hypothetical protein